MKIALAGNIASGKSTVQKILENCGFKVLDTDVCAHQALKLSQLKEALSNLDIFIDVEISREKLAKLVFNDDVIKTKLEKLVHPIVRKNILDFFEANKNEKFIFVAIPLVFEAHMEDLFDKIVFVYTDDDIRKKRLINRNNYDEEFALKRINSQDSQEDKISRCDFVIYNNGTRDELKNNVTNFLNSLK